MKRAILLCMLLGLGACSALQAYKDQSFEYLQNMAQHPSDYYGQIVSFGGEIKGLSEDTRTLRFVLKTDAPFYYAATGKGGTLAYELLLVDYAKTAPQMSGLQKGNTVKILARVSSYEKRKNMLGTEIGVLHLTAFAVTDRTQKKDWFHTTSPEKQLYESWKKGRLFYEDTPQQIIAAYPAPAAEVKTPAKPLSAPQVESPLLPPTPPDSPTAPAEIIYDEEEDFVLSN